MGFLDKVKDSAKTVGDRAKSGVAAGQEKLDDRKLAKQVEEYKNQIGDIVYAQRTGGAPDDAEAEIDRLVAAVKDAEAAMEANSPAAADAGDDTSAPEEVAAS